MYLKVLLMTLRYYRCDIKGAEEGLLAGKTVAIKDNVSVAGVPMMNGSKLLEGFVPDKDATVVSRILDAGMGYTRVFNNYCNNCRYSIEMLMLIAMQQTLLNFQAM